MRVVIVADFAEPSGGAPAVALQSALALAARGVPVSYIHGIGRADPRLAAAGIDVLPLGLEDVWDRPALQGAAAGIWNRDAARRLARVLGALPRGRAVLHLHQWTRSLSPACFGPLLASPHPLVVTLHDYGLACPNGVYYRFDKAEPCRLTPLSPGCVAAPCDPQSSLHKVVRLVRAVATRRATRRGGFAVVHVSDRGRDTIGRYLPPSLVQRRIDNPVEAMRGPSALVPAGGAIAYVGRLTREKGADLVAAAGMQAGVPLLFVGTGPAEGEVRRLAPSAMMAGWRSREEVERLLREEALALAAPSRWDETGPLTVYEALAAGLPPVVSLRAGAAEKVAHGETGFVIQPEVEALAAAFRDLAVGATARRMGGEAYRRYWAAPLDGALHADRLLALYGDLLRAEPARPSRDRIAALA